MSLRRVVARTGLAADVPTLRLGEIGWDTDLNRFRVGDDTTAPPVIMSTKSLGSFDYSSIDDATYPKINMVSGGTVDGVDISELNSASGVLVRTADNSWGHRTFQNTDGYLDITNPSGVNGNPVFNVSAGLLALFPTGAFLETVEHDDSLFGEGTLGTPLGVVQATEAQLGGARIASQAQIDAGTSNQVVLTPASLTSIVAGSTTQIYLTNVLGATTMLSGTGAPSNSIGADGNYYWNISTADIYGPKTGGVWPTAYNAAANAVTTGETPPTTPSLGAVWFKPSTDKLYMWISDGNSGLWMQINVGGGVGGAGGTHYTSETEPLNPVLADAWYVPSTDRLYQYVNDGASNVWMKINSGGGGGGLSSDFTTLTAATAVDTTADLFMVYDSVTGEPKSVTWDSLMSQITIPSGSIA